jgi:hypothetical protein
LIRTLQKPLRFFLRKGGEYYGSLFQQEWRAKRAVARAASTNEKCQGPFGLWHFSGGNPH